MKNLRRTLSVIFCVILVATAFFGCTFNVDVAIENDGKNVAANPAPTAAPATAAPTQAPTQAPQASTPSTPAPGGSEATTAGETPAAPSGNATPTTTEEIVAEYVKVYNTTKAAGTFTGKNSMECPSIMVDGKDNSALKKIAEPLLATKDTGFQLPPHTDSDPGNECLLTAADVKEATYNDNKDGTATIKIVPVATTNSKRFQDAQGKMFNVMEDLGPTVAKIPGLSWSEGDETTNVKLITDGGYAEVTYNIDTKMMTKAEYVLITIADVQHANVNLLFLKDKSAQATFKYTESFPG